MFFTGKGVGIWPFFLVPLPWLFYQSCISEYLACSKQASLEAASPKAHSNIWKFNLPTYIHTQSYHTAFFFGSAQPEPVGGAEQK